MADGSFDIDGRTFTFEVVEVHTESGEDVAGFPDDEQLEEADQIFYSLTAENGETYYRWIGGPFLSIEDVQRAIEDETDYYVGLA